MGRKTKLIITLFLLGILFGEGDSLAKGASYLASMTDNKIDLLSGMTPKISVKVIDRLDNPIEGQAVNFKIIKGNAELNETQVITDDSGVAEAVVSTDKDEEANVLIEVDSEVESGSPVYFSVNTQKGTGENKSTLERWTRANEKYIAAKEYFNNILTPLFQTASSKGKDVSYPGVSYYVIKKFISYANDDLEYLQKTISAGRYKRPQLDYFERLETEVRYLQAACEATKKELQGIISGVGNPSPHPAEIDPEGIKVANGDFYSGSKPFFLIGPDYGNVELGELQGFGFNYYGVSTPPMNAVLGATFEDYIKRKDEKFHLSENLTKLFKEAREDGVMLTAYVPISIDYRYMPRWFYGEGSSAGGGEDFDINPAKKIDKIGCGSDHNMAFCILNPCTKEMLRAYYGKVIPELKEYPSILSYMIGGEIWYKCSPFCPLAEADFRQWLSKKYNGNIEKLNINWGGTKYKTFSEIKLTDSYHGIKLQERYDYLAYDRWAVTEFFRWVSGVIKESDPTARVHFRLGGYFDHYYAASIDRASGIDLETLNNKVFDIAEVATPVDDWRHQVFNSDLNRSLAPSRPGLDEEWAFLKRSDGEYGYNPSAPYNIAISPEKYIGSRVWEDFIHGKDAIGFFMWARELEGRRWEVLSRPKELDVLGRTALDIRRLAGYIVDFHNAPSEVALLYSVDSKLQPNVTDYITELEKAYTGLFFLDTKIDFITEDQINNGELSNYRLLVAPKANYINEETYRKIKDFVYNGGSLFVTKESLLLNEYGIGRDPFFSAKDGEAAKYGSGTVYYYGVNFSQTNERAYQDALNKVLDLAGINRPIRILDEKGNNYWGIEMRFVNKGDSRIIYLLNLTDKSARINIKGISSKGEVKDLITGNKTEISPLAIEPLGILLLRAEK